MRSPSVKLSRPRERRARAQRSRSRTPVQRKGMVETREERDLRRGLAFRSFVIAAMIAAYGGFMHQPAASFRASFLIAIALQAGLIALKRWVPHDRLPKALFAYETFADGVTVLLFALGVFGGIQAIPQDL